MADFMRVLTKLVIGISWVVSLFFIIRLFLTGDIYVNALDTSINSLFIIVTSVFSIFVYSAFDKEIEGMNDGSSKEK